MARTHTVRLNRLTLFPLPSSFVRGEATLKSIRQAGTALPPFSVCHVPSVARIVALATRLRRMCSKA